MYGDRGLRVVLGESISKETNEKIRSLTTQLEKERIDGDTGIYNRFYFL